MLQAGREVFSLHIEVAVLLQILHACIVASMTYVGASLKNCEAIVHADMHLPDRDICTAYGTVLLPVFCWMGVQLPQWQLPLRERGPVCPQDMSASLLPCCQPLLTASCNYSSLLQHVEQRKRNHCFCNSHLLHMQVQGMLQLTSQSYVEQITQGLG